MNDFGDSCVPKSAGRDYTQIFLTRIVTGIRNLRLMEHQKSQPLIIG
jgi:hypothetical protein